MPRVRLYAYKQGSASGKALAERLGIRRIKHRGSRFVARESDSIVNWGASTLPPAILRAGNILNHPSATSVHSNKLTSLRMFEEAGVNTLEFTECIDDAKQWIAEGGKAVCRTILNGSSGAGIVIASSEEELVPASLYTRYFKKKEEYRVHFVGNRVIDVQRKMRKLDVPDDQVNWQVRNMAGGFVFGRNDVEFPEAVSIECNKFIAATDLDFGAIDVLYNARHNEAVVCEVNTAPGLVGTTLDKYGEALNDLL